MTREERFQEQIFEVLRKYPLDTGVRKKYLYQFIQEMRKAFAWHGYTVELIEYEHRDDMQKQFVKFSYINENDTKRGVSVEL